MKRRVLFVDDDPAYVELAAHTIADALGHRAEIVTTVEDAVAALHAEPRVDVIVADVFIPLGAARDAMGPRARRCAEQIEHLGGLVLLDEPDRLASPPLLLSHTACVDKALLELLGGRAVARVRKPAPGEVLLKAVLEVLRELDGG